jgi:F-type H+-transporting ATPase subunit a
MAPQETFDAGKVIIGHVANSSLEHALIPLPTIFGINFSVTKHVFMLWVVAATILVTVTTLVRRYVAQARLVPTGPMNVLEVGFEFIYDSVIEPSIPHKWTKTWAPLILTLFVFILGLNLTGLLPTFEVLGLLDHFLIHSQEGSFFQRLLHGGATPSANLNVTAGLAVVTFVAIIVAGSKAHGFVKHWLNLVPKGLPLPVTIFLIPIEIIGMLVRPFALTMRLAANMTGGHIAILAILSFVFIFTEMLHSTLAGVGLGLVFSVPLAAAISGLEIIVVLVQAYVFTLLSAVFIGMAIDSHH